MSSPAKQAQAQSLGREPQDHGTFMFFEPVERATVLVSSFRPHARAPVKWTCIPGAYAPGFTLPPAPQVRQTRG
jgi:hypothetical protein